MMIIQYYIIDSMLGFLSHLNKNSLNYLGNTHTHSQFDSKMKLKFIFDYSWEITHGKLNTKK